MGRDDELSFKYCVRYYFFMTHSHHGRAVGLDVSDRSVTAAEIVAHTEGIEVISAGRGDLPVGVVEGGVVKNRSALIAAIHETLATAIPKPISASPVVLGLPEHQTFIHLASLSLEENGDKAITREINTGIPLPSAQRVANGVVLGEGTKQRRVFVLATSRVVVTDWVNICRTAGLHLVALEPEPLALLHGLFTCPPREPVCVVDIGATTSMITITGVDGLRYAYAVNVAGDALTHAVAVAEKISVDKAEQLKIEHGLTKVERPMLLALVKAMEPVLNEVRLAFNDHQSRFKASVNEVVIVGGSGHLKGLSDYFSENLAVPVRLGAPAWPLPSPVKSSGRVKVSPLDALRFVEAIGLARHACLAGWNLPDPILSPDIDVGSNQQWFLNGTWVMIWKTAAVFVVGLMALSAAILVGM